MPYKSKEEKRKNSSQYYQDHKKVMLAQSKEYYERNKEEILKQKKIWSLARLGTPIMRFQKLKSKAKKEEREMSISLEEYSQIVKDNICSYCKSNLPLWGYGLDRIDNQRGYLLENVVPCCTLCNFRKGRLEGVGFTYPRNVELLLELIENAKIAKPV